MSAAMELPVTDIAEQLEQVRRAWAALNVHQRNVERLGRYQRHHFTAAMKREYHESSVAVSTARSTLNRILRGAQ